MIREASLQTILVICRVSILKRKRYNILIKLTVVSCPLKYHVENAELDKDLVVEFFSNIRLDDSKGLQAIFGIRRIVRC